MLAIHCPDLEKFNEVLDSLKRLEVWPHDDPDTVAIRVGAEVAGLDTVHAYVERPGPFVEQWREVIYDTEADAYLDELSDGRALILHPTVCEPDHWGGAVRSVPSHYTAEEWQRFRVGTQIEENARRDRATLEVCKLVLMGYVEGRDVYARRLGRVLGDFLVASLVAEHSVPTYHEMRAFLIGELDASEVTAAAAAFSAMRYCNPERMRGVYDAWHGDRVRGDRGWV